MVLKLFIVIERIFHMVLFYGVSDGGSMWHKHVRIVMMIVVVVVQVCRGNRRRSRRDLNHLAMAATVHFWKITYDYYRNSYKYY
jgi:hypothetical protein